MILYVNSAKQQKSQRVQNVQKSIKVSLTVCFNALIKVWIKQKCVEYTLQKF